MSARRLAWFWFLMIFALLALTYVSFRLVEDDWRSGKVEGMGLLSAAVYFALLYLPAAIASSAYAISAFRARPAPRGAAAIAELVALTLPVWGVVPAGILLWPF